MNVFFMICAVVGVTLLACVTFVSILGLDGTSRFLDQDWNTDTSDGLDSSSSRMTSETPGERSTSPGSALKEVSAVLRRLSAATTFFGLTGYGTHAIKMSSLHTFGLSALAGAIAYYAIGLVMQPLSFDPFDENSSTFRSE
ncbi:MULTISPECIES: hypothetical protein [unclassified Schlesneria]|uniref:hypothetical protein n=1 Tax=unclassified Schlesneria TaxID=2762017 RepID=UPI002F15DE7C